MWWQALHDNPVPERVSRSLFAKIVWNCVELRYHNGVQQFERITMDPAVMGGEPCIRGMRVTVGMVIEAMAAGRTIEQLLADFPYIQEADIREALAFARTPGSRT